jgi:hypothetical protein
MAEGLCEGPHENESIGCGRVDGRARGFRPRSSLRRTLGTPRSGPAGALAIALRRRGLTQFTRFHAGPYHEGQSLYGHYNVIGNALEWVRDDFIPYVGDGRGDLYAGGDATDPLMTGTGNRLARSPFGSGWRAWDEDHLRHPAGVRCAFGSPPEMLAR